MRCKRSFLAHETGSGPDVSSRRISIKPTKTRHLLDRFYFTPHTLHLNVSWDVFNNIYNMGQFFNIIIENKLYLKYIITRIYIYRLYENVLLKMSYILYRIAPRSRVLEKLKVTQLVKKFAFFGTRRFITVFIAARHWSLTWARRISTFHCVCRFKESVQSRGPV
jgi:hypothetical protein